MVDVQTIMSLQNKWVAFSGDRSEILASGDSVKAVIAQIEKLKVKDSILSYITPADKPLAPYVCN